MLAATSALVFMHPVWVATAFPSRRSLFFLNANAGGAGLIISLEGPLEKEMATHSRILAWEIPRTEKPGELQSMGLQKVRQDLVTEQKQQQQR